MSSKQKDQEGRTYLNQNSLKKQQMWISEIPMYIAANQMFSVLEFQLALHLPS